MNLKEFIEVKVKNYLKENTENDIWYHGSDHKFTEFEKYKLSGSSSLGIFVTEDRNLAELFGEYIYATRIKIKNPYQMTMDEWDDVRSEHAKDTVFFTKMRESLIKNGYDGILINSRTWKASSGIEFNDGKIAVVFDKNNIEMLDKKFDN